jgi:hypothetical protein
MITTLIILAIIASLVRLFKKKISFISFRSNYRYYKKIHEPKNVFGLSLKPRKEYSLFSEFIIKE